MRAWGQHIKGAAALLALRGPALLGSPLGISIFGALRIQIVCVHRAETLHQLRYNKIAVCMQTMTPIPEEVKNLSLICPVDDSDPYEVTLQIMMDFSVHICELMAEEAADKKGLKAPQIISVGLALSKELSQHLDQVPTEYKPQVKYMVSPDLMEPSLYNVFSSLAAAMLHHTSLLLQIVLHECVAKEIEKVRDHSQCESYDKCDDASCAYCESTRENSISTIRFMIDAVRMNVRYFTYLVSISGARSESVGHQQKPKAKGCLACLWPLYVAGATKYCLPDQRTWITGQLEQITVDSGVQQARTLADMIRNQDQVTSTLREKEIRLG